MVIGFYYYAGILFGKSIIKATEGVHEANKKWETKKTSPIDTIKKNVIKVIDSSKKANILNDSLN